MPPPRAVVLDTMVISWLLDQRPNHLADRYRAVLGDAAVILASRPSPNCGTAHCAPG